MHCTASPNHSADSNLTTTEPTLTPGLRIRLILLLLGSLTNAAGNSVAGNTKAADLGRSLKAFKSSKRMGVNTAQMAPGVSTPSEQDMTSLAAYFASLPAAK